MQRLQHRQINILTKAGVNTTTSYDISGLIQDFLAFPTLILTAIANSGAADLDVTVEASADGVNYVEVLAFPSLLTGVGGVEAEALPGAAKYMRVVVTLSTTGDYGITIDAYGPCAVHEMLVFAS